MIRRIKYNMSVHKFNQLLDTVSSVGGGFDEQSKYYFNNYYPSGFDTLFYIVPPEKSFVIRFNKIFEYELDFGLNMDEMRRIISDRFNTNYYNIV